MLAFACLLGAAAAWGCAGARPFSPREDGAPRALAIHQAPPPSAAERYCAWYGAADDGVLYFGQSPFWSSMRAAGGDPMADLARPGPQLVGRFDLEREELLPPLQVGRAGDRSGVWDVLPLPGGEVLFTSFFGAAGSVDPASGEVRRFDALGAGLNEWAPGPGSALLVTRYGSGRGGAGDGELLAIGRRGSLIARWALPAPPGYRSAPKTPLWDPVRATLWVTTDLLPRDDPQSPDLHDALVLAPDGTLLARVRDREIQFAARGADGTLYFAELSEGELWLRVVEPDPALEHTELLLDADFPVGVDFVQDIQPAEDGRVAITRWSGAVHVMHPDRRLARLRLPRLDPEGLYYTGVLHGDRLCATYCADVTVVCADSP